MAGRRRLKIGASAARPKPPKLVSLQRRLPSLRQTWESGATESFVRRRPLVWGRQIPSGAGIEMLQYNPPHGCDVEDRVPYRLWGKEVNHDTITLYAADKVWRKLAMRMICIVLASVVFTGCATVSRTKGTWLGVASRIQLIAVDGSRFDAVLFNFENRPSWEGFYSRGSRLEMLLARTICE